VYGRIIASAVAVAFTGLIFGDLAIRDRNKLRGSIMIGARVLPGTLPIAN
jgi:hypothetical protein